MKRYKLETDLKVRGVEEDFIIEGYFAKFNVETTLYNGFNELIEPGAFVEALTQNDVRCLFNHDTSIVLGRLKSNTLKLREDEIGLYGELTINREDTNAMNIYHQVKRGDISGCSFGFVILDSDIEKRGDTYIERLKKIDLKEVSICPFPQYEQTEITARSEGITSFEKRENLKRRLKKYEN